MSQEGHAGKVLFHEAGEAVVFEKACHPDR
jgi:hypothetical protein